MKILVYNVMFLQGISDQWFWLCPALYVLAAVTVLTLLVFTGILLFSKRYNSSLEKQKDNSTDKQEEETKNAEGR